MNSKHSWETTCDHGECFGGECIYAKATDAVVGTTGWAEQERVIEALRRQVAEAKEIALSAQGESAAYESMMGKEHDRAEKAEAENAALREWESRCAVALGVPGCNPEEMLHVIDNQREDADRYRWFRSKRLWDADQFPWPKDFEYPDPCLWDEGKMLDAAIDAVRKA